MPSLSFQAAGVNDIAKIRRKLSLVRSCFRLSFFFQHYHLYPLFFFLPFIFHSLLLGNISTRYTFFSLIFNHCLVQTSPRGNQLTSLVSGVLPRVPELICLVPPASSHLPPPTCPDHLPPSPLPDAVIPLILPRTSL